jgi:hypothetical protein
MGTTSLGIGREEQRGLLRVGPPGLEARARRLITETV